jgi:hypothetical protein
MYRLLQIHNIGLFEDSLIAHIITLKLALRHVQGSS